MSADPSQPSLNLFGDAPQAPPAPPAQPLPGDSEPMASGYATGRDQRGRPHLALQPCRSCRAPMLWVAMTSGKRNPLDADPHPDGNVILVEHRNPAGEVWRLGVVLHNADLLTELRALAVPLYRSHFATCEHADEHRREQARERRDLA